MARREVEAGDCVLMPHPYGQTEHLWIVIASIGDSIAIVNLNSQRRGADETVVLLGGEHPFVKHRTVVTYADARIAKKADLIAYAERQSAWCNPVSLELLARIQAGAVESEFCPLVVSKFIQEATPLF